MKKLYKITGPKGEPLNGGSGKWHLPRHGKPAKWMPVVENIEPCERGYHLVGKGQLIERAAARDAARDAEKKYQTKRLFWYLTAPAAAE